MSAPTPLTPRSARLSPHGRGGFLLVALLSASAFAQVVPEREVQIIQSLYETGKYAEVVRRVDESLAVANFTDAQRIKLLELSAVSAFNTGDTKTAQASFLALLKLNPDHILDPFAVPPPAIKVFDQVKKDNGDALNLVRQQLALRAEQDKRAAAERERLAREEEERKRQQALRDGSVTVRTVEKRNFIVNLLPFGAGQFQQGRMGAGAAFAVVEGLTAILSLVSYFAIECLFQDVTLEFWDRVRPAGQENTPYTVTVRQIPANRRTERDVWTGIKYATGAAFYALWAVGAGEAIWHHQDEVVTEQKVPVKATAPSAQFRLYPAVGGIGAGLTIRF